MLCVCYVAHLKKNILYPYCNIKHKNTKQKISYTRYIFWPVHFGPKMLGLTSDRWSCIFGALTEKFLTGNVDIS